MTWPLHRRRAPGWHQAEPVTINIVVDSTPPAPTPVPAGWLAGLPQTPGRWAVGWLMGECVIGLGVLVTCGPLGADESCAGMEFVHRSVP